MHQYIGLLGTLLVILAVPLTFIRQPRVPRQFIVITLLTAFAIALFPVHDLMIAGYVRGIIGDLSITSMILLMYFIIEAYSGKTHFSAFEKQRLHRCILLLGLILYPFALGLSLLDSYSLGYGNFWLIPVFVVIIAGLIIGQSWIILAMLICGISGYVFHIMESSNLWDYLIDIWIFLYCLLAFVCRQGKALLLKVR